MKIHLIAAARPNFMKIAPLYHELKKTNHEVIIVHTGQHYDKNMSDDFFEELGLPSPHIFLNVHGGSHAYQVGNTMIKYEEACLSNRPDLVIVVGDVNATMACSITAKKMGIPVAHLEAGIRSFDDAMPEEINRRVTDSISDWFWTPSLDANDNLIKEGVATEKIKFVGNIMIDSLEMMRDKIAKNPIQKELNPKNNPYAVVTFHRPSNVDSPETLSKLITVIEKISKKITIIFPIHPRTKAMLSQHGLLSRLTQTNVITTDPLSYTAFMNLIMSCQFALTDSGGIQEETTYLGIPCLTVRNNTERPITVTQGTNTLVQLNDIISTVDAIINQQYKHGEIPQLWDGNSAKRVVAEINQLN